MANEIKRLNYFTGQFLAAQDFIDEQAYHVDMRRRQNRLTYSPGVVDGGFVAAKIEGNDKRVTVSAGLAVDKDGRELIILLPQEKDITGVSGTEVYLSIKYADLKLEEDKRSRDNVSDYIRITERVEIMLSTGVPADNQIGIELVIAKLTLDAEGKVSAVDTSVKMVSQLLNNNLSTAIGLFSTGLQINTSKIATENFHWISDTVNGPRALRLYNGNYGVGNSSLTITSDGKVGIGTTNPITSLDVTGNWNGEDGAFRINGDKPTLRLNGGELSGNRTWIMQLGGNGSGNLEFYSKLTNRPNDWMLSIAMTPASNIGINTPNPVGKLDVANLVRFGLEEGGSGPRSISFVRDAADELNAGKIAFRPSWDPGALGIVGAGQVPRRIHLWDNVVINGNLSTNGFDPNIGLPNGWLGGIHTFDIYAEASIGLGTGGGLSILLVSNGIAQKPNGGSWGAISDKRLKKNIKALTGSLDSLLSLKGVSFEWINPENHGGVTQVRMGMIAQEVEKIFPEWVSVDSTGHKLLSIWGFEALVIESFRELNEKYTTLKKELEALKTKIKNK